MSIELEGAEVLERAAEVLETDGWCQGVYYDDDGQHCAMGAVKKAALEAASNLSSIDAVQALARAVRKDSGDFSFSHDAVVDWNDHPDRTADEVIEALKLVAKDLRNQAMPA